MVTPMWHFYKYKMYQYHTDSALPLVNIPMSMDYNERYPTKQCCRPTESNIVTPMNYYTIIIYLSSVSQTAFNSWKIGKHNVGHHCWYNIHTTLLARCLNIGLWCWEATLSLYSQCCPHVVWLLVQCWQTSANIVTVLWVRFDFGRNTTLVQRSHNVVLTSSRGGIFKRIYKQTLPQCFMTFLLQVATLLQTMER